MENESEELLRELLVVEHIVRENPCKMNTGVIKSLTNVIHNFIGEQCMENASRTDVARYYGRDVRTITRWKEQYPDFPVAHHHGHREISYNWFDVVKWKIKHKELWEGD